MTFRMTSRTYARALSSDHSAGGATSTSADPSTCLYSALISSSYSLIETCRRGVPLPVS